LHGRLTEPITNRQAELGKQPCRIKSQTKGTCGACRAWKWHVSAAAPGGSPLQDEQGFEEFYVAVFGRLVTGDRGPHCAVPIRRTERPDTDG